MNKQLKPQKVKKAVVLLAGYGTRCLPFTKVLPKAMIPILSKPAINYIIDELEKTQIKQVLFILPKDCNGKIVKQYFKPNKKYEGFLQKRGNKGALNNLKKIATKLKITYVFTSKANGSGGAVLNAKRFVKGQPFVLINGDDLFVGNKSPITMLIENYEKHNKNVVLLKQVPVQKQSLYGIYEGRQSGGYLKITKMVEKPKPGQINSNLAAVGRYLVKSDIFAILKQSKNEGGEIPVTNAFKQYIKQGCLNGVVTNHARIDAGNIVQTAQAGVLLALENQNYKQQMEEFLKQTISNLQT